MHLNSIPPQRGRDFHESSKSLPQKCENFSHSLMISVLKRRLVLLPDGHSCEIYPQRNRSRPYPPCDASREDSFPRSQALFPYSEMNAYTGLRPSLRFAIISSIILTCLFSSSLSFSISCLTVSIAQRSANPE